MKLRTNRLVSLIALGMLVAMSAYSLARDKTHSAVTPAPRGANPEDKRRQVNSQANERIAKLADGESVYFLDIGPKFLGEDGSLSKEIMPDLLHLSEKGYTIWAESIEAKVKELMGET